MTSEPKNNSPMDSGSVITGQTRDGGASIAMRRDGDVFLGHGSSSMTVLVSCAYLALAAALAAFFDSRTRASDSASTMSATDIREPSSP